MGGYSAKRVILMSRKPEKNTHDTLFDGIETKLLVYDSKPQIDQGFLKSTK